MWIALAGLLITTPFELHAILRRIPSHFSDLYSPWMGMRGLIHGVNPYSRDFTEKIFSRFYGRPMNDQEFETQAFVYPGITAFLFGPIALMSWKVARIFTTAILPPLVALTTWIWCELCFIERRYRWIAIGLVTCSWPAIWAYQQTQPTVIVIAAVTASVFLLARNHDIPAAMCLVFATAKPNLSGFIIAWLLVQMAIQRRWRFVIAFASLSGLVLGGSVVAFPGWVRQWITAAMLYDQNPFKPPELILLLGKEVGGIAILSLGLWLIFWLFDTGVAEPGTRQFTQAIALLLAFTTCVIPTTTWMIYNELALIPAVFLIFAAEGGIPLNNVFARLCIFELLAIVPICVVSMWVVGYNPALSYIPFLNVAVPFAVTLGVAGRVRKALTSPTAQDAVDAAVLRNSGKLA